MTYGYAIRAAGSAPRRWRGFFAVLTTVAIVSSLTGLQRVGAVSLSSLAASPREVADGRVWLLVSSGAVAAEPLLWSLLSFCALAFVTLALCGWRVLWLAAFAGQTVSTLLGYSIIGVARLVEPGAFQRLVSAPDYGVSAISAAWLGAIAAVGWRKRRESLGRATIVLGCVAAGSLAWFVRGRGLDVLDSEHFFAFAIGGAVAWLSRAARGGTPKLTFATAKRACRAGRSGLQESGSVAAARTNERRGRAWHPHQAWRSVVQTCVLNPW
jgi:hypothetical protein